MPEVYIRVASEGHTLNKTRNGKAMASSYNMTRFYSSSGHSMVIICISVMLTACTCGEDLLTEMCPRNFLMALPVETSVSMTSLSAAPLTMRLLSAALEHKSNAHTVNLKHSKMSG